ncbi:MAG TPA: DegT/DnrJ/EryC1/StrS family aminotransferase [Gemmatimonadota bacterium]|jgi:dTDP-4-amino-4,6-dideoxygalactose transaminase
MDEREAAAARRVILSGWVTQGPEVAAFEEELAASVGADHACAVSSCTAALHLALRALGAGPGDEVVTASHSYVATANAIRHTGAVPVFADVDAATFNLDPARVEAAITPRTRAVLCVHQMGLPCDLAGVLAVTRPRGVAVVEDAACALGSQIRLDGGWEAVGRPHGDVACFSFHPRKVITTGDGGMLTTRDAALDRAFRRARQHGMSIPDTVRHRSPRVLHEAHEELGWNYRMTDVQAAIGREQLRRLPEILLRRRRLAARYAELLADVPGLTLPREPEWARGNWQSYCVLLPAGCDRDRLRQRLLDRGIATRPGIVCSHREPVYAVEPWREGPGGLHASEDAQDRGLLLPLFPLLSDDDQARVARELREALAPAAAEERGPAAPGRREGAGARSRGAASG